MIILTLAAALLVQTSATPQSATTSARGLTLAQLIRKLPGDIRSGHFDFGSFSEAVTTACVADPASFASGAAYFAENLNDPNEKVRFYTLAALDGLSMQTGNTAPIVTLQEKIEAILLSDTDDNRLIAINTASNLGTNMPESYIRDLETMLGQRELSQRLTLAAGRVLMGVQPMDAAVQQAVIAAVSDPNRPQDTRCQLLNAAASELAGSQFTEFVIATANSSIDKYTRDCAISAAERIGARALTPVAGALHKIAQDPAESAQSKLITKNALESIQTTSSKRPE